MVKVNKLNISRIQIHKRRTTEKKQLKCMYTNVRSLMNKNKRDELRQKLLDDEIDMLGLTESWTHEEVGHGEIEFSGYVCYRKDRNRSKGKERGGGVLLYITEQVTSFMMEEEEEETESIWVRVGNTKKTEMYVGVVYRSPTIDSEGCKMMYRQIKKFSTFSMMVMGDFNFGGINWQKMESDNVGQEFFDTINDCFLTQHVIPPTRGENILDLILTTEKDMVNNVEVDSPIANS